MSSSSTYAFAPSAAAIVLNGFGRIQIRPTEITTQHLNDAQMEANLLGVEITNRSPNQFARETPTIDLVPGTATYALPSEVMLIGLVYLTTGTSPNTFDRPLGQISATDWAAITDKTIQGPPTTFWLDLLPVPTLTLWPVPDGNGPYILNIQSFRQMQDVALQNGQNFDGPFRLLDALAAGMAYRLSRIYRRELTPLCKQEWEDAWTNFASMDSENVALNVIPGLGGFYR